MRRSGGGRAAAKNSTIREKIQEILKDEVAGDSIDGTRWMRKTMQSISAELCVHRIEVSANTVGWLPPPAPHLIQRRVDKGFSHPLAGDQLFVEQLWRCPCALRVRPNLRF